MDLKQMALDAGAMTTTITGGFFFPRDDGSIQRFAQAVAEECAKACEHTYPSAHATAIRNLFREQV